MKDKVIVIVGPTAVGKTKISIQLAKMINGEIISADSMQIYKYMDIGTAKPDSEEMEGIKHYMIDVAEPSEEFNVAKYKEMALKCIEEVLEKGKKPIIVGGTGLYVNALTENIEFSETISDPEYREMLQDRAKIEGTDGLYQELQDIDPESAKKIHKNDLRRIIRALEVYKFTGKTISYHNQISKQKPSKYDFIIFGLNMDREKLYRRIDMRVEKMLEAGLEAEVRKLMQMGVNSKSTSMQGLGYKEFVEYLQGDKKLEETVEIIKRDSRRYAKRQLTWFRRNKNIIWLDSDEGEEKVLKKIFNHLEANGMFM